MKKFLAAIASFILVQSVSAQVNTNISGQFSKQFPDTDVQKWEAKREGYVAHFRKEGQKWHAYYTADGEWVATESPVRRTKHLPEAVRTAWENSGYAAWYVHNIRKIETTGQPVYVLHLNNGTLLDANKIDNFKVDRVLYYSHDGQLIRSELL